MKCHVFLFVGSHPEEWYDFSKDTRLWLRLRATLDPPSAKRNRSEKMLKAIAKHFQDWYFSVRLEKTDKLKWRVIYEYFARMQCRRKISRTIWKSSIATPWWKSAGEKYARQTSVSSSTQILSSWKWRINKNTLTNHQQNRSKIPNKNVNPKTQKKRPKLPKQLDTQQKTHRHRVPKRDKARIHRLAMSNQTTTSRKVLRRSKKVEP